jgi:hypothetical protein
MSDTAEVVADQGVKVYVTFTRKVSDGDYGSIEASAFVQAEVPRDSDPATVGAKLQESFAATKVVVLDELAIPYTMDDNGTVREKNIPTVGMHVNESTRVEHALGDAVTHTVKIMNRDEQNHVIPTSVIEQLAADGVAAVWVNKSQRGTYYTEAISKADRDAGKQGRKYNP